MKVVLLKNIPGVGRKNEVKDVSDGYALKMLIPKKLEVPGTPTSIAHAERLTFKEDTRRTIHEDLLFKNLALVQGLRIEVFGKANEQGHLFASIHPETIITEMKKQKGVDLSPEFLQLDKPIKEVGEHKIPVKVRGKTGGFTLVVKAA